MQWKIINVFSGLGNKLVVIHLADEVINALDRTDLGVLWIVKNSFIP